MTALLIGGACICLNLLLYRSGATGMDDLGGFMLKYQTENAEVMTIEIPPEKMNGFLKQFSQEIYDAKVLFGRMVLYGGGHTAECSNRVFCQRQSLAAVAPVYRTGGKNQSGQSGACPPR